MRRIILLIFIAATVLIMTVSISQKPQTVISNELGIDVSSGSVISNYDDHGGSHGDGMTCIVLNFSDNKVLEQIKANAQWEEFPLDETVRVLVSIFTKKDFWDPLVPEIQNGYYRLIDRQTDQETDIMDRYSFNFSLGLYDTDTDTLYYCKLDT